MSTLKLIQVLGLTLVFVVISFSNSQFSNAIENPLLAMKLVPNENQQEPAANAPVFISTKGLRATFPFAVFSPDGKLFAHPVIPILPTGKNARIPAEKLITKLYDARS